MHLYFEDFYLGESLWHVKLQMKLEWSKQKNELKLIQSQIKIYNDIKFLVLVKCHKLDALPGAIITKTCFPQHPINAWPTLSKSFSLTKSSNWLPPKNTSHSSPPLAMFIHTVPIPMEGWELARKMPLCVITETLLKSVYKPKPNKSSPDSATLSYNLKTMRFTPGDWASTEVSELDNSDPSTHRLVCSSHQPSGQSPAVPCILLLLILMATCTCAGQMNTVNLEWEVPTKSELQSWSRSAQGLKKSHVECSTRLYWLRKVMCMEWATISTLSWDWAIR